MSEKIDLQDWATVSVEVLALIRLARAARAYLTPWPVNDDPDGALFTELVAAADAFTDSAEAK